MAAKDPALSVPNGLTVHELTVGDEELAVLSFSPAPASTAVPEPQLTAAERDVLALLLRGLSNDRIAKRRGSAPRTVANQVASLFRKFGVTSRAELAARLAGKR